MTLTAKPGQRARLRLINAGSDTAFRVALGGHRLTITHTTGSPSRSAAGTPPTASARPAELAGKVILSTDLTAADAARLPIKDVDWSHDLLLSGSMAPYRWTINGKAFPDAEPLPVEAGQRVQLRFQNMSMMFHPTHVHGHTFALVRGGAGKDTVIVRPMQTVEVDLLANNPGQWATHSGALVPANTSTVDRGFRVSTRLVWVGWGS